MLCQNLSRKASLDLYQEVLKAHQEALKAYQGVLKDGNPEALRDLCREDLFFLLVVACGRVDANNDWIYDRCREVEANPNGRLDLWAREHYKSTVITFALTIQDILKDPNVTIGIFSHTRPIAKAFLGQIKTELENNTFLQGLFPEILYKEPKRQAAKWSLNDGIVVKRSQNPKESTIEAWGLVDGQPTSKHFKILLYDDVVTRESVTNAEQIRKTTEAWELSLNLGAKGGSKRYIGTRYHLFDTYSTIMERGAAVPRIYPATKSGKWPGEPVLLTKEELEEKRAAQGPFTFASQMLQNPTADKAMGFNKDWLEFYEDISDFSKWNLYLLVDPASKKKKGSDYTVMQVWGLGPDQNYYLIDAIRDRLNLTERTNKVFEFHRKYQPKAVGYEEYGLQADIEHIQYVMEQENYRFKITTLKGQVSKEDRIRALVPKFEQSKIWLPKQLNFVDYERRPRDFVKEFIEHEYVAFPVSLHDDMLDCMARILDPALNATFPMEKKPGKPGQRRRRGGAQSWMG